MTVYRWVGWEGKIVKQCVPCCGEVHIACRWLSLFLCAGSYVVEGLRRSDVTLVLDDGVSLLIHAVANESFCPQAVGGFERKTPTSRETRHGGIRGMAMLCRQHAHTSCRDRHTGFEAVWAP